MTKFSDGVCMCAFGQSCNHPFLADATLEAQIGPGLTPREILEAHIQMSGKMRLLHLILPILQSAGWRVVIFAQVWLDLLDSACNLKLLFLSLCYIFPLQCCPLLIS